MKLQCQNQVAMYTVVTCRIKRVWYQKLKTVLGHENIDKHNFKCNFKRVDIFRTAPYSIMHPYMRLYSSVYHQ